MLLCERMRGLYYSLHTTFRRRRLLTRIVPLSLYEIMILKPCCWPLIKKYEPQRAIEENAKGKEGNLEVDSHHDKATRVTKPW